MKPTRTGQKKTCQDHDQFQRFVHLSDEDLQMISGGRLLKSKLVLHTEEPPPDPD